MAGYMNLLRVGLLEDRKFRKKEKEGGEPEDGGLDMSLR